MSNAQCEHRMLQPDEQCILLEGHAGPCFMLTQTGYSWDVDEMRLLVSELARSWCAKVAPKWSVKGATRHLERTIAGECDALISQARAALFGPANA